MKLKRSLVVFDIETTGTWIEKDKIIEIAMLRREPDGSGTEYLKRVNPGMPIPPVVSSLTGITNEDVKNAPRFSDIAAEVVACIGDADIGGFNAERFDLPILERELAEARVNFDRHGRTVYDAQKVYHLNEPRDLAAGYRFYCGKELLDAHSAMADTKATLEILESQVKKYGEGSESIEFLKKYEYGSNVDFYDRSRKFRWWNGELYPMFGKYARRWPVKRIARDDRPYLQWIVSQDFSEEVKGMIEEAIAGRYPDPPE